MKPEPHNTHVLNLLFEMAHWHGLAKLRMHTDVTLELLSQVTTSFGARIRAFFTISYESDQHYCPSPPRAGFVFPNLVWARVPCSTWNGVIPSHSFVSI
jgi:hypothetical protein